MLYHHDARDYEVAASEAATRAKAKLEKTIADARDNARAVYAKVMSTSPDDAIIRNRAMEIEVQNGQVILAANGIDARPLSSHALGQLCSKAGMPRAFAQDLLENKNARVAALVKENLATLLREGDDDRSLVRAADGQVRGVMSDSYKIIDSRPMLDTFVKTSMAGGLVPVFGAATETRASMRALLPMVFEPAPHEVIAFGLSWENSDYGAGAHTVNVFMLRLWCTNFAITERALRQVHLGKRLDDVSFSNKTRQLEAQTSASALKDIIGQALSPERVAAYNGAIAQAATDKIDANKALDALVKTGALQKGERNAIGEKFVSADVEMLPAGNTTWRLSNAISWFAHAGELETDRRIALEKVAGNVLPAVAKAA